MSRYQDTVIDEDEESCPLCIEEFDLSDKNFRPCPCGYQICQFCFNSLKNTYEKSTCPNCRRLYDESTIQYKIPTAEELKADQLNKSKKLSLAKRKETEKREVETSNRRNLAGLRVKQQNLVYVIGLEPSNSKDEAALMETLRGKDYFGQYGPIEKIVVSKPKPGAVNQGVGVYVTFKNKDDAARCITAVDGTQNLDKVLRAQYGTTKYCSTYLRGDVCQNKNCSFLHENGEEGQNTTLQNEPIENKPKVVPARSVPTPQPQATSQAMAREASREGATSRQGSTDGSALPPTVGWANAPVQRARRASQAASASTASPQLTHAALAHKRPEQPKQPDPAPQPQPPIVPVASSSAKVSQQPSPISATKSEPEPLDPIEALVRQTMKQLRQTLANNQYGFVFDDSSMSPEARAIVAAMPPLIDPYGGVKRRIMADKEAENRAKLEAEEKQRLEEQARSAAEDAMDEESMATGSLALGGEPEENPRSASARGTIGRPPQQTPTVPIDQLSNLNLNRSLTPQQRQQLAMLNVGNARMTQPPTANTAFEMSDFDRRGPQYSQAQYDQISGHARNGSRYFNNESKANNNRFSSQQQPYFPSGVQGPPPGLPTAGTPPVSGGGMFAHGQGFTSSGFGAAKDNDSLRARSGTNNGPDAKRELLLSLHNIGGNPLRSPPAQASAPGLLNGMYGQYPGAYQDPSLVKQRKKGKKQRHANTSSSGGGVDHLSDPSILSARIHQGAGGQGLFGGNQGDEHDFPPLPKRTESAIHSRVASIQSGHEARAGTPKVPPGFERSSTPKVPPGFEERTIRPPPGLAELHAHPSRSEDTTGKPSPKKEGVTIPIVPVVPAIPTLPRSRKSSMKIESNSDSRPLETIQSSVDEEDEDVIEEADDATVVPDKPKQQVGPEVVATEEVAKEANAAVSKSKTETKQEHVAQQEVPIPATNEAHDNESKPENANPSEEAIAETISVQKAVSQPPVSPAQEKKEDSVLDEQVVSTPDILSRAATSPPKKPEPVKRPTLRTLQITSEMIAQSGSQALPSTTTERSAAFPPLSQIRQSSRQPSISVTTSRPSTPAASERFMSHDVSRAGSPPPSLVGSAPARGKTKAQLKKDRKKKASEMSETGSVAAAPAPPAQEAVAPIVARQKKQKKSRPSTSAAEPSKATKNIDPKDEGPAEQSKPVESKSPTKKASTDKHKSQPKREPSPPPKSPTPPPPEPELPPQSYTLRDLYTDLSDIANYDPTTGEEFTDEYKRQRLQDILASHISPLPKLLAEMVQDGDIAKTHPLFNPPPFTSAGYKLPPDNRKGQSYLDGNNYNSSDVFGMVYLPNKEKKALYQGHAVSVADSGERADDLLRRCLITPGGWILRHLSREEGERVLDLEERRQMYLEDLGDIGRMDGLGKLEENDYSNLEGGFDELSRFGERHGVCWVVGENDAAERGFRRARYGRRGTSHGLEDDYGLGEAPLTTDDFDENDQFDDPEDEDDDDEELEGEEMVLEAANVEDGYELGIDEQDLPFTDMGVGERVTLPPLPEMMGMPGAWDATFSGSPYPTRARVAGGGSGMYASLQPITDPRYAHSYAGNYNSGYNTNYNYTSDDINLPPPPPLPLPPGNVQGQANTLAPIRHANSQGVVNGNVNLRGMDVEQLERRVKEKAREVESSRKEVERVEKMVGRKGKDVGRWRGVVLGG
ncbi:transcriptional repressor general negative regulator of transcription subunit 4 [Knufia obscura]|uniref:Transcriptional repressor general negative regulator of transcription subunit 4 n=1 Tax=Knufia obscura TaxID=1635080 RepID=A0ABR0RZY3_9EURO|nr:transcriptional repressor general negative regulator of transcription subunit 4 [Knufia obscura]